MPQGYLDWLKSSSPSPPPPQLHHHKKLMKLDTFALFDRVVYTGPIQSIFGLGGIIVGVYPILGEETIEVMFDQEFEDAISIRSIECLLHVNMVFVLSN